MKSNHQLSEIKPPWYFLALLILAGESVFILPFVLPRIFRPTVLEIFEMDNVLIGFCFSVYGIVAVASYIFGGPLADRFPPRKLMAIALWMTALGGLIYSTIPSYQNLVILYGYWGFTTIFLFWASMIKAARVWGGKKSQGKAFGFLDGGRGLVGALFGTLGVIVFSLFLTSEISVATVSESQEAYKYVVLISSAIVSVVGVLVWFFMKLDPLTEKKSTTEKISLSEIKQVLKLPSVWLLMIIILCAYVGYKITDLFSQYSEEIMGFDKIESAKIGTLLLYVRPAIGILIGLLADRTQTTLWLFISFVISFIGALFFATGLFNDSETVLFFMSIFVVATGVYAARSLYFAVMEKGQIPLMYTGTAVGLISVVGYTPDIFAGLLQGFLLDNSPGVAGYRHVFWTVAGFSLIGGTAAWYYHKLYKKVSR